MSRRLILVPFVLMLMAFTAVAQDDVDLYLRAAGNASNLYRGRKALDYKFPYNGTYFWESPTYHPGRVCYNGKVYSCDAVNIDAAQQELLVKDRSGVISVMLNRDYVTWFETGGRRYICPRTCYDNPCNIAGEDCRSNDQAEGRAFMGSLFRPISASHSQVCRVSGGKG